VVRPRGQVAPGHTRPSLVPTSRLDFEAELGFVVGAGSPAGQPVPVDEFADHVFGVVLLIDWTAAQQLAHLTVNGAALRTGDLYGSGTVSSFQRSEMGSLLELTVGGREPITLAGGQTRGYLADGDTVTLCGSAPGPDGSRIEFGCASGRITAPPS
jgi:2-keto-4-pentenoate hydratase/2-oxohepta-3-ene-1,7-dioic acid hydratase in catechol pathway